MPSNSNTRYAVAGFVLLIAGAGLLWFLFREGSEPPPSAEVHEKEETTSLEPSTALGETKLVIPEVPPDAGSEPPAEAPKKTRVRTVSCTGEIPRESIQAEINEQRRQVRTCYEKSLRNDANLRGTLRLLLRIDQNGQVGEVRMGGTLHDEQLFRCVRSLTRTWRFLPPKGGACTHVEVPFDLAPRL